MNRRELISAQLGPASCYIPNASDKPDLIEWAILTGKPPVEVHAMSLVDLVNLYHAGVRQASPNDAQRGLADTMVATIERILATANRTLTVISPQGSVTLTGAQHYRTELVIKIVGMGHPAMLVGPAGCGKTTIGERTAQALNLSFYLTSTINDTHELLGFVDGYGNYHTTPFRVAFETGGLWIADEIDAWDAAALLAANSALANGYCQFPDRPTPIARHARFRMVATANTFGTGADRVYVGRNELDAASLDRFAVIEVDYDLDLERMFAGDHHRWLEHVWKTRKAVNDKRIRHVVSSRAISMGAAALSVGIDWDTVETVYLLKGMSGKDRDKIT